MEKNEQKIKCKELSQALQNMTMTNVHNYLELGDFYYKLSNILECYSSVFDKINSSLSKVEREQLKSHMQILLRDYSTVAVKLNKTLITLLEADVLSKECRDQTDDFTRRSLQITKATLDALQHLDNSIIL